MILRAIYIQPIRLDDTFFHESKVLITLTSLGYFCEFKYNAISKIKTDIIMLIMFITYLSSTFKNNSIIVQDNHTKAFFSFIED